MVARVRKAMSVRTSSHSRPLLSITAAPVTAFSVEVVGGSLQRVHSQPRRAATVHRPATAMPSTVQKPAVVVHRPGVVVTEGPLALALALSFQVALATSVAASVPRGRSADNAQR